MLTYEIISEVDDSTNPKEVKYLVLEGEITTEIEYPNGHRYPEEVTRYRVTGKYSEEKTLFSRTATKKEIQNVFSAKVQEATLAKQVP